MFIKDLSDRIEDVKSRLEMHIEVKVIDEILF